MKRKMERINAKAQAWDLELEDLLKFTQELFIKYEKLQAQNKELRTKKKIYVPDDMMADPAAFDWLQG